MQVGFPSLECLHIEGLQKLRTIWHTQLDPHSFCKVTHIFVGSCPSLKHILVPGILEKLESLKRLMVWNCESLEAVFNVKVISGRDHDQSHTFTFGNLLELSIQSYRSLKNVLSASMTKVLEKLDEMYIIKCEILEQNIAEEEVKKFLEQIFSKNDIDMTQIFSEKVCLTLQIMRNYQLNSLS